MNMNKDVTLLQILEGAYRDLLLEQVSRSECRETNTESEEMRCLKRRKEDFREAMRLLLLPPGCL